MIFVTGMFRSGTTFLARLLNKHKDVAFASDPFFAIFKDFRNALAKNIEFKRNTHAPLEDYYFCEEQNAFFHSLQNTAFTDVQIPDLDFLKKFTYESALPYSPLLAERFFEIQAVNYGEFLQKAALLLNEIYGPASQIGFKEVWANEFTPHIIKLFQNRTKVVYIVRDPRAITVSNFYSEGRYPLLFLGRQWRKLTGLAFYYSLQKENSILVKYEDLISNPESTIQKLCNFLDIEYSSDLLKMDDIVDGGNQRWIQNSTFQEKSEGFNKKSIYRWKEKISKMDQKAIEFLCYSEMKLLGYTPEFVSKENWDQIAIETFFDQKEKLAAWIRPFSEFDYSKELELEKKRIQCLYDDIDLHQQMLYFLYPEIYKELKINFS